MKFLENLFVNAIFASAEAFFLVERIVKLIGAALIAPLVFGFMYGAEAVMFLIVGGVVSVFVFGGDIPFTKFMFCSYVGSSVAFLAHMIKKRNF